MQPSFKSLFGVAESEVTRTCVLLPVLSKDILKSLGINHFYKGKPYSTGIGKGITVIHTRIGAPFVGDAVLFLKDTPCQNFILFGSCGAVRETAAVRIGAIVTPVRCYSFESYSDLLNDHYKMMPAGSDLAPDKDLLNSFRAACSK